MPDSKVFPVEQPAACRSAAGQSAQSWRNLWRQIAGITPKQLGRLVLGLIALKPAGAEAARNVRPFRGCTGG
jgi:hypothetical protein